MMSATLFSDGDYYNAAEERDAQLDVQRRGVPTDGPPKEGVQTEGAATLDVSTRDDIVPRMEESEDPMPIGNQQRNDLGSLFSIDDYNPFSSNHEHLDQNLADGGDERTITEGPDPALAVGVESSIDDDQENLVAKASKESRFRRLFRRFRGSSLKNVVVTALPESEVPGSGSPESNATTQSPRFDKPDTISFQQAVVLLEDAAFYRSINHSLRAKVLGIYRLYHSRLVSLLRYFFILLIHILAFLEKPSSLSVSSDIDPRRHIKVYQVPTKILAGTEMFLLLCFCIDVMAKGYLSGTKQFFRSKWLVAYLFVVLASITELSVHLSLCYDTIRFRRILRPFFLLQNSSLLKKTVNCLKKSLPEVLAILCLLLLHIYIFSLIYLLIYPYETTAAPTVAPIANSSGPSNGTILGPPPNLEEAFINLFVLLTTANNPDVTLSLYTRARFYAVFFIIFLLIGLYCFMNMLTAVIYNQFRGYFLTSMQSSHIRRVVALRASFEVLRHLAPTDDDDSSSRDSSYSQGDEELHHRPPSNFVPASMLMELVTKADLRHRNKPMLLDRIERLPIQPGYSCSQFMKLFDLMDFHPLPRRPTLVAQTRPVTRALQFIFQHHWFTMFGNLVTLANVVCITVQLWRPASAGLAVSSPLYVWNMIFIVYYVADLVAKIWAQGWPLYLFSNANVYEGVITILIIIAEAFHIMEFGFPHERGGDLTPIWNIGISFHVVVRIVNILIILKLLRILADVKAMNLVASTIYDIFLNLTPFAGILVVMYYTFAIIGMELFRGAIQFDTFGPPGEFANITPYAHECGSYQELGYWPNNFNDFASTIVVLWNLMVVNNWHVFLQAYKEASGKWSQIFFIIWFIVSVIIGLNLFTALILENFIMRWDKAQKDELMRERLMDCAQSAGVQYSVNHPHLTVSELDESVNHTVHNLFRSNFKIPDETEILKAVQSHTDLQTLLPPRQTMTPPGPPDLEEAIHQRVSSPPTTSSGRNSASSQVTPSSSITHHSASSSPRTTTTATQNGVS